MENQGMTIKELLDKVDIPSMKELTQMADCKEQYNQMNQATNPQSAYLGPKLWDKPAISMQQFKEDDFFVMNFEEFMAENSGNQQGGHHQHQNQQPHHHHHHQLHHQQQGHNNQMTEMHQNCMNNYTDEEEEIRERKPFDPPYEGNHSPLSTGHGNHSPHSTGSMSYSPYSNHGSYQGSISPPQMPCHGNAQMMSPNGDHRPGVIVGPCNRQNMHGNSIPKQGGGQDTNFLYAESKRAKMEREKEERKLKVDVNIEFAPEDLALATVPGINFDPRARAFDMEELRPQPIIRKRPKVYVPPEKKDEKYWEKRGKNNVAARRSREARRLKENQIALRAAFLERENQILKSQLEDANFANTKLTMERDILRQKLAKFEAEAEQK